MSAYSVIRPATTEDVQKVVKAAQRFCTRHAIPYFTHDADDAEYSILYWIETGEDDKARRRAMWSRVLCRALKVPQSVKVRLAFGYVVKE